ncbi:MAG: hypothetical protein PHW84_08975 [Methanosarcina sp.]|nr:hypothetical protein [Methanosarcina sp.]
MTKKSIHIPYDKLIRDKIPEIINTSNRTPECKTLDDDRIPEIPH